MLKAIVFSIYGGNTNYLNNFIDNLPIYKHYFFDFDILLFYDDDMSELILDICSKYDVKAFPRERLSISDGMFWRFEPIIYDEFEYELILIRDVDYQPTEFELKLINEFIESDDEFQILRLHHDHMMPIMGGLFGIKSALFSQFKMAFTRWCKNHSLRNVKYNDDQLFLSNYVYYKVVNRAQIVTSNIKFYGESVRIIKLPLNVIVGGDFERHSIDPIRRNLFVTYPPVYICNFLRFRGIRYFSFTEKLSC